MAGCRRNNSLLPAYGSVYAGGRDCYAYRLQGKILSDRYYDAITDFPVSLLEEDVIDQCYADVDGLYNIIYFDREELRNAQAYFTSYRSMPKLYGLMQQGGGAGAFDPNSLIASGIAQVQREPLALTGTGVIICCIDTGIDYLDPVFRNEDGTSRILAIWDQTIQTGTPPRASSTARNTQGRILTGRCSRRIPIPLCPAGMRSAMAALWPPWRRAAG